MIDGVSGLGNKISFCEYWLCKAYAEFTRAITPVDEEITISLYFATFKIFNGIKNNN